MDWQKIINDLQSRALSTTFDNEREICLKKIQELKISMGLNPGKKTENNMIKSLPIKKLRSIFVEIYCSWYLKDKIYYPETNTILYQFDRYNLHYIFEERYKLDLNPDVSLKMLKYRKSIRDWAFEEYQYIFLVFHEIYKIFITSIIMLKLIKLLLSGVYQVINLLV